MVGSKYESRGIVVGTIESGMVAVSGAVVGGGTVVGGAVFTMTKGAFGLYTGEISRTGGTTFVVVVRASVVVGARVVVVVVGGAVVVVGANVVVVGGAGLTVVGAGTGLAVVGVGVGVGVVAGAVGATVGGAVTTGNVTTGTVGIEASGGTAAAPVDGRRIGIVCDGGIAADAGAVGTNATLVGGADNTVVANAVVVVTSWPLTASGTTPLRAGTDGPRMMAMVFGGCVGSVGPTEGNGEGTTEGDAGTAEGRVGPRAAGAGVTDAVGVGGVVGAGGVVATGRSRATPADVGGLEAAVGDVAMADRVTQMPRMAQTGRTAALRRRVIRTPWSVSPRLS